MLEGMIELTQFVVIKKNKLKGIAEMILNLDELDNTDNLEDGKPSNSLLTYQMDAHRDFTHFEPKPHSTRNLKMKSLSI